jgi:hypothetical protein
LFMRPVYSELLSRVNARPKLFSWFLNAVPMDETVL